MSIIGNGDIAKVLPGRKDLLFFASGVSDSKTTDESEFARERDLLLRQDKVKHLVYFSSLAVFEKDTSYFKHKRMMESLVKVHFDTWTIVRLGNIAWGSNPNTIINFLRNRIKAGLQVEIRDEYKYIVDKDEFLYWIGLIPTKWSCEMSVVGRRMKVSDIIQEIKLGEL